MCGGCSGSRSGPATWPSGGAWPSPCVIATVSARPEEGRVVIDVEDDGPGIPPGERVRIFDRGARLDTGKPGTGLGLAIVRDVAEIYSGSVELTESEDMGGLLVRLSLPAV